jgi:HlyD family type I secretion membrane fusion protein
MTEMTLAASPRHIPPAVDTVAGERSMRRLVTAGVLIILAVLVFFVGWATIGRLDSAVIAHGVVAADGNRKAVQHADGGIVEAILVREGEPVEAGQELIRLDAVQTRAALDIQNAAVDSQTATIARLESERDGAAAIRFPSALSERSAEPAVAALLRSQAQLFNARRTALSGQGATVEQQIRQARAQADGLEGQVVALEEQRRLIEDELTGTQTLYDKGLTTKTKLLALKRASAALLGQRQDTQGNIARLRHAVAQLQNQRIQLSQDQLRTIAQELEDARARLADAHERQRALQDVLDRTRIRAPAAGYVLGLNVHTRGAVIGRGERLLEIVPKDARSIVEARVRPVDGEHVRNGTRTELKLLSAAGRDLPSLHGTVITRSVDLLTDERTGERFYSVQVIPAEEEVRHLPETMLKPGVPIEVILLTGSRTALDYMLEPLLTSFRHGLREE